MLWFITLYLHIVESSKEFKYILCYGSSICGVKIPVWVPYLNTSYVMVHQEDGSQLCHLYHLNTSYVMVHPDDSSDCQDIKII